MNAILGFGQLLQLDSQLLTETQSDNINEIMEAGQHLLSLINEVLDLATIESGKLDIKLERVSISDAINQSLSLISPLAAVRNIEIINQIDQNYELFADATRLMQVLVNLLSNAVKYNVDGGKITLSSEVVDCQLRLSVTDTGIGLSKKDIETIFLPFERKANVLHIEGTGIGLAITKNLVELMGGCIGIESTPEKGSTFWIQLDCDEQVKINQA